MPALAPGGLSGDSSRDPNSQQSLYKDLFGHAPCFPSPEGSPDTDSPSVPSKGCWQVPVHCSPGFVFLRLILTSLPFIWVLEALCTSKPLVYTRNSHEFLPKDAASRQTPQPSYLSCPGGQHPHIDQGGCVGSSLNPTAPIVCGVTWHILEPSPGPRCWSGTRGCCWDRMMLGWDAAHPSDPGREVSGTMLGNELREGRYLPLGVSSPGKTPKIIFGLS